MTAQELHDDKIRDIAEEYRQRGYEVTLEPQSSSIPGFDRGLCPDLLAKKDRDHVVVEVKSRNALRRSDTVRRMADALAKVPDWRFELIVVEDAEFELEREISPEAIEAHLVSSDLLIERNQFSSAFMLAWVAAEAALRKLAASHRVNVGDLSPLRLFRELSFNGLINREDYESLNRLLASRNRIVHGFDAPKLTVGDINTLSDLASRLLVAVKEHSAAA